jgi:hypothetical protein
VPQAGQRGARRTQGKRHGPRPATGEGAGRVKSRPFQARKT